MRALTDGKVDTDWHLFFAGARSLNGPLGNAIQSNAEAGKRQKIRE